MVTATHPVTENDFQIGPTSDRFVRKIRAHSEIISGLRIAAGTTREQTRQFEKPVGKRCKPRISRLEKSNAVDGTRKLRLIYRRPTSERAAREKAGFWNGTIPEITSLFEKG